MEHRGAQLKIRLPENLPLSHGDFKKIKKGEILHLTLSFIKNLRDRDNLDLYIKRSLAFFGEKLDKWDREKDFKAPLEKLFSLPQITEIFPEDAKKVLIEKNILIPTKNNSVKTLRPDRVVMFEDEVRVIDFKSEEPVFKDVLKVYKKQVREYCGIIKRIFKVKVTGYLVFVLTPKIEILG